VAATGKVAQDGADKAATGKVAEDNGANMAATGKVAEDGADKAATGKVAQAATRAVVGAKTATTGATEVWIADNEAAAAAGDAGVIQTLDQVLAARAQEDVPSFFTQANPARARPAPGESIPFSLPTSSTSSMRITPSSSSSAPRTNLPTCSRRLKRKSSSRRRPRHFSSR
jgi:hypothetical protein